MPTFCSKRELAPKMGCGKVTSCELRHIDGSPLALIVPACLPPKRRWRGHAKAHENYNCHNSDGLVCSDVLANDYGRNGERCCRGWCSTEATVRRHLQSVPADQEAWTGLVTKRLSDVPTLWPHIPRPRLNLRHPPSCCARDPRNNYRARRGRGRNRYAFLTGSGGTACAQLLGVLATGGPPLSSGRSEASKKCPGIPRPSGVEQRVVPGAKLMRQFRIAQFDRPLFNVQTKLWIVERQLIHASE